MLVIKFSEYSILYSIILCILVIAIVASTYETIMFAKEILQEIREKFVYKRKQIGVPQ